MVGARSGKKKSELEVVSVELPAPEGWVKKFIPKQGGTPRRNEIFFISPTGEEIKNMRQLDQFLRSHPGGPPSSSFDWGTGDTPRRSARISEKVKILPELEKPKRASRSSEKLKSSPEVEKAKLLSSSNEKVETVPNVEKNKLDSSSGLQKGTKRNKNTKYSGDESKGEADEEDGSKFGDKEDAKGSKKRKKRKKTAEDEGHTALGESSKDVDMEEAKGTKLTNPTAAATIEEIHGLADHDSTEITKGNAEGLEQPIESEGTIEHELVDKAEKMGNEKTEQDVELLDDIEDFSTAAVDSEKVVLIEKNDATQDEATSEGSHGLVEDKSTEKTDEFIEENAKQPIETPGEIKHELAYKAGENDVTKEDNGAVNNNFVFGLIEPTDSDKVALSHMDDQVSAAKKDEDLETSGNTGIKDKEVETTQKDFIEQHVEVSATKNDEASVCIKESVTLSENGGKGEEVNAALDDFIHDNYDDQKMRIEPSPSNC